MYASATSARDRLCAWMGRATSDKKNAAKSERIVISPRYFKISETVVEWVFDSLVPVTVMV